MINSFSVRPELLHALLTADDAPVDISIVVVLVVVLDGQQRVKEDVDSRGPDTWTQPGHEQGHLSRLNESYPPIMCKNYETIIILLCSTQIFERRENEFEFSRSLSS